MSNTIMMCQHMFLLITRTTNLRTDIYFDQFFSFNHSLVDNFLLNKPNSLEYHRSQYKVVVDHWHDELIEVTYKYDHLNEGNLFLVQQQMAKIVLNRKLFIEILFFTYTNQIFIICWSSCCRICWHSLFSSASIIDQ